MNGMDKLLKIIGTGATPQHIQLLDEVDNETRKGRYLNVQKGLTSDTFFVGWAKDEQRYIAELVA